MLTYAIHQKNPADKTNYSYTNDVYFTNGSQYLIFPFEYRNNGIMKLADGSLREYWTTNRGLVVVTPYLTDKVTVEWLEISNKACTVLPYRSKRITSWLASCKKQLAQNEVHRLKVAQYINACTALAGGDTLSEVHYNLAKEVMEMDWNNVWTGVYSSNVSIAKDRDKAFSKMRDKLLSAGVPGFFESI